MPKYTIDVSILNTHAIEVDAANAYDAKEIARAETDTRVAKIANLIEDKNVKDIRWVNTYYCAAEDIQSVSTYNLADWPSILAERRRKALRP
jgi:hypothetical protein